MPDMQSIMKSFFSSSSYAVAGASNNTDKFGYKLLQWYASRKIPVTPITPSSSSVLDIPAVASIADLERNGQDISLSVVTPPKVTLGILKDAAKAQKLHAIWLQPGAEDAPVTDLIRGDPWLEERTVYGGPCVLVLGDRLRKEAASQEKL